MICCRFLNFPFGEKNQKLVPTDEPGDFVLVPALPPARQFLAWSAGVPGALPLSPGVLCHVCACVCACVCPAALGRSYAFKAALTTFWNVCCSPLVALGDLSALHTSSLHAGGSGLPARSLCPLTAPFPSPGPLAPCPTQLWPVALGCPRTGPPGVSHRSRAGDTPPVCVWLVVLWEKWRIQ